MKHTYIRFFSLLLLMSQATFAQVQVHIHMKDSLAATYWRKNEMSQK